MAPKRPKKQTQKGPLEQALDQQTREAKAAQRKASASMLPINIPKEAPPFYYRNPKHKYGTCWKCGTARVSAGGSPGGDEAYWCGPCGGYLAVRDRPSDPAVVLSDDDRPKQAKKRQK